MKTTGLDEARAAKERVEAAFAGKASVVGIGITRVGDGYGVKVNFGAPPGGRCEPTRDDRRCPHSYRGGRADPQALIDRAAGPVRRGSTLDPFRDSGHVDPSFRQLRGSTARQSVLNQPESRSRRRTRQARIDCVTLANFSRAAAWSPSRTSIQAS